ncbi:16S rRNA (uracil(1498)-N(3))-methyltransferase [Patescibacteria group bacterium]|nr:16S rRNA (uracil(1498)-N(3))-methyltransferase [Patescibacteria group bacterium]MBU1935404.1 16S rRNA (uracil(1498)-N(3))-methyltransferase [Patescibacteria group bacterium]
MHRFYLPSLEIKDKMLIISDKRIVHQTGKVLRMWKEDRFQVFDDNGDEFVVEIESINKFRIIAEIVETVKSDTEPSVEVSLYQAVPKKPALFELVVQKATELGVARIFPLITERTEKRRITKFERLFSIAMEATEQSGRTKIPVIQHPVTFEDVIGGLSNPYIGYEYEGKKYLLNYGDSLYKGNELQIIIGPEGGLSQHEIDLAKEAKVKPFTLGPRILRTETAAISALSLVLLSKKV